MALSSRDGCDTLPAAARVSTASSASPTSPLPTLRLAWSPSRLAFASSSTAGIHATIGCYRQASGSSRIMSGMGHPSPAQALTLVQRETPRWPESSSRRSQRASITPQRLGTALSAPILMSMRSPSTSSKLTTPGSIAGGCWPSWAASFPSGSVTAPSPMRCAQFATMRWLWAGGKPAKNVSSATTRSTRRRCGAFASLRMRLARRASTPLGRRGGTTPAAPCRRTQIMDART